MINVHLQSCTPKNHEDSRTSVKVIVKKSVVLFYLDRAYFLTILFMAIFAEITESDWVKERLLPVNVISDSDQRCVII